MLMTVTTGPRSVSIIAIVVAAMLCATASRSSAQGAEQAPPAPSPPSTQAPPQDLPPPVSHAPHQGGLIVREVTLSSGYTFVQLPPITLGGYLPLDPQSVDLLTTAATDIFWSHSSSRANYLFAFDGSYTSHAKYTGISSFGGSSSFSASHAVGNKWRVNGSTSQAIMSTDQLAFQPTQASELAASPARLEELANALALARSVRPANNPDVDFAELYVPINQSLAANDIYGNRMYSQSVNGGITYSRTQKLSIDASFGYSRLTRLSSSGEPGFAIDFPDTTAQIASGNMTYSLSHRSYIGVTAIRSISSGQFNARTTSAMFNYGWSTRRWFVSTSVGMAVGDPALPVVLSQTGSNTSVANKPQPTYQLNAGFKSRTQTFIVGTTRSFADANGFGNSDPFKGYSRDVTSLTSAWYWSPVRSKWQTEATLAEFRNFGNFSYIYTWHVNAEVGRQVRDHLRLSGEFLFDRHGSKGFEGFHLSREGFIFNVIWTPQRRLIG
jgi:hypothetical protein